MTIKNVINKISPRFIVRAIRFLPRGSLRGLCILDILLPSKFRNFELIIYHNKV